MYFFKTPLKNTTLRNPRENGKRFEREKTVAKRIGVERNDGLSAGFTLTRGRFYGAGGGAAPVNREMRETNQ